MVPALTYQTLPPHIIKIIMQYTSTKMANLSGCAVRTLPDHDSLLVSLLSTSRVWRQVVLLELFGHCSINVGTTFALSYTSGGSILAIPSNYFHSYAQYVRYVRITFNYENVLDGSALAAIVSSGCDSIVFNHVRSIDVELHIEGRAITDFAGLADNVGAFVRLFQRMIPSATIGHYHLTESEASIARATGNGRDVIIQELMGVVMGGITCRVRQNRVFFCNRSSEVALRSCASIGSMTHLTCRWDHNYKHTVGIIHANAKSLVVIDITFDSRDGLEEMIVGDDGCRYIYTGLWALKLKCGEEDHITRVPPTDGMGPFPQLGDFTCSIRYPFSDDTPLRGNICTLQRVELAVDDSDIGFLAGLGVLARTSPKPLRMLQLSCEFDETQDTERVGDTFKKLIHDVLPCVGLLQISGDNVPTTVPMALFGNESYHCMENLSLNGCHLSLSVAVRVLYALPQLKYFIHKLSVIGSEYEGMSVLQIGEQLRAKHNPLNRCLRKWDIGNSDVLPERLAATWALLLIDRCPLLQFITAFEQRSDFIGRLAHGINNTWLFANFKKTINPSVSAHPRSMGSYLGLRIDRHSADSAEVVAATA